LQHAGLARFEVAQNLLVYLKKFWFFFLFAEFSKIKQQSILALATSIPR
jgi:hypothetical protein